MKIQEKLINFIKNNKPKKIVIHNLKNSEDIENVIKQIYLQKLENYDYFFEKLDLILISNWLQISEFEELKNHWFKVFNLIFINYENSNINEILKSQFNSFDLIITDSEQDLNVISDLSDNIVDVVGNKIKEVFNSETQIENQNDDEILEVIKVNHDAGFFSVCNINLHNVVGYYCNNQKFCVLDTSEQWNWYKDKEEDLYNKFFKFQNIKFNLEPQPIIFSEKEDQFSNYKLINHSFVSHFIAKYFYLSDEVLEIKQNLLDKYNLLPEQLLSVCYRGNDKLKETNLPTYQEMLDKINNVLSENPNLKVLIQSDEKDFCDYMKNVNNNFIVIDEIEKINKNDYAAIQHTIPIGNKVKNAQKFLAIMSIISDSKKVILNSGNVGMWTCFFRGNSENVYQYLNTKEENIPIWF
jgi:hypothetical protein